MQEDYIQDPDLADVYEEEVPNLSDSGSGETLVLRTQRIVDETESQASTLNVLTSSEPQDSTLAGISLPNVNPGEETADEAVNLAGAILRNLN